MDAFYDFIRTHPDAVLIIFVLLIALLVLFVGQLWVTRRQPSPDWAEAEKGQDLRMLGGALRGYLEEVRDAGPDGRSSVTILIDSPGAAQDRFDISEGGKVQYRAKEGHYYEVTLTSVTGNAARFRAERYTEPKQVREWEKQDDREGKDFDVSLEVATSGESRAGNAS